MRLILSSVLIISVLVIGISQTQVFSEEEKAELVYFDIEKNNELVKEEISNAFWENPLNTPPFLVIIGIGVTMIIISWKRKWHKHESEANKV